MIAFAFLYMKKNISLLWVGFISTILAGVAEVSYPFLIQEITNLLLKSDTVFSFSFTELLILTLMLSIIIVILHFIIILTEQKITSDLGHDLRKDIYSAILHYPWLRIKKYHTGNLSFRIKNDTGLIGERIRTLYSDIIYDVLAVTGPFIIMLFINAKLAVLIILSITISTFVINPIIKKAAIYERALQIYNARFSGHIQESLFWIKTVKLNCAEELELKRISHLNLKLKNIDNAAGIIMSLAIPLGYLAQFSSTLVVLGYGGNLLMNEVISPGNFVAIFVWEQLMADSIKRVGKYVSIIYSLQSLIQRISELLNNREVKNISNTPPAQSHHQSLDVYINEYRKSDNEILLKDINIQIQRNETLIITGDNGSGKSTFLDIILKLLSISEGSSIRLNGKDMQTYSESTWLSHFSLMNQHTQIIKGSLRENLIIANPAATDKELITALISSGGETLFEKCHYDLLTQISEKGNSLSGGERQIIGLARIILKDAPIVFLDEPTTYLDHDKIDNLVNIINVLMQHKTVVIISHDPRLFPLADRIIEIKDNNMVERDR